MPRQDNEAKDLELQEGTKLKDTTWHRSIRSKATGYDLYRMNMKSTEYEILQNALNRVIDERLSSQGGACMISVKSATRVVLRKLGVDIGPNAHLMRMVDDFLIEHFCAEYDSCGHTKGRVKQPLSQRVYRLRSREERIKERTEEIAASANLGVVC